MNHKRKKKYEVCIQRKIYVNMKFIYKKSFCS